MCVIGWTNDDLRQILGGINENLGFDADILIDLWVKLRFWVRKIAGMVDFIENGRNLGGEGGGAGSDGRERDSGGFEYYENGLST